MCLAVVTKTITLLVARPNPCINNTLSYCHFFSNFNKHCAPLLNMFANVTLCFSYPLRPQIHQLFINIRVYIYL